MYAVLHFPRFALQAVLRHEPDGWARPVALVDLTRTATPVVEASSIARDAGVTDGLTAPQALARCPGLSIRHRSLAMEAAATEAILQCSYGFSPNLEATAPDTVTLDLRGLAELKPATKEKAAGEDPIPAHLLSGRPPDAEGRLVDAWARRLRTAMGELGFRVRVGIGPSPNVARHAARWGNAGHGDGHQGTPGAEAASRDKPAIICITDPSAFVSSLPVAALDPSSDVEVILRQWGIRTVGEFLGLGQVELAERFGLEALALIAAASVTTQRPLHLVVPSERFQEHYDFEAAVETVEPLLFILQRFVGALGQRLEALGFVAAQLTLTLHLESGDLTETPLRVPQPTRRSDVLFRMLHTHLEMVRTESPIKAVGLVAEPAVPEQRQFSLFEAALRDPHQFQDTLARLVALVGADRVGTPVRENGHRPDSFSLVPPQFERLPAVDLDETPAFQRPVPFRRFRPPIPARVTLEEGQEPTHEPPLTPSPSPIVRERVAPAREPGKGDLARSRVPTRGSRTLEATHEPPVFRSADFSPQPRDQGEPVPRLGVGALPNAPGSADRTKAQRPVAMRSDLASGALTRVAGPWRLSGRWWEGEGWERDEWEAGTREGWVIRLTREQDEWSVDGVLD